MTADCQRHAFGYSVRHKFSYYGPYLPDEAYKVPPDMPASYIGLATHKFQEMTAFLLRAG